MGLLPFLADFVIQMITETALILYENNITVRSARQFAVARVATKPDPLEHSAVISYSKF